jgi:membrane-associated protein
VAGALDFILTLPPLWAYAVVGLLVFGEAAVFVGFVLPGETAVVLGGVLAARGDLSLWPLVIMVVVCAVVGDTIGYEVGRHYGDSVLGWRPLRRHRTRLDGARDVLRRRGGLAVFLGRWTAFLRAVMPGLAGLSRMSYPRFLAANAAGGIAWGVTFCLVGYLAGNSYTEVEKYIGRGGAVATVCVLVVALVAWHLRKRRLRRRPGHVELAEVPRDQPSDERSSHPAA